MLQFDATQADCWIFTYKEGLLSPIAHDLQIAVTRFSIAVDLERLAVTAEFAADSLRVVSAMRDGQPAPQLLSQADHRKIEQTIFNEVLAVSAYPRISFASTSVNRIGGEFAVVGQLTLHGQTRELRFTTARAADRQVAEVRLHQPDYGIRPYAALLGTLRVKPDVTVRLSLPRWEA